MDHCIVMSWENNFDVIAPRHVMHKLAFCCTNIYVRGFDTTSANFCKYVSLSKNVDFKLVYPIQFLTNFHNIAKLWRIVDISIVSTKCVFAS